MGPGDIDWFPSTRKPGGEAKARPVLIIAEGPVGHYDDHVLVVAEIVSSGKCMTDPLVGDILLDNWVDCGLANPWLIRARKFWTTPRHLINSRIGRVSTEQWFEARSIAIDIVSGDA